MIRTARLLPTVTLAALAMAAAFPGSASAQMVPRMVSYVRPATTVVACTVDPASTLASRRTIAYARGNWSETVQIFKLPNCSPESALFTVKTGGSYALGRTPVSSVAYRTVTPTADGAAYLQQQCTQYAWSAGVAQNVSADRCAAVATL